MSKAEIYQQDWCIDLIKRLGRYKEVKSRLEVLETILDKQGISISEKLVASYGKETVNMSGLGSVSPEEWEHREKLYEVRLLDAALNSLTDLDKAIVMLRYIEKVEDWHLYDIQLPRMFEKYIGKSTYYDRKKEALQTMGRCLGYAECYKKSDIFWTNSGTQAQ
ncbi:MAG: ArpU family phage packaging/lysis transcriptional regulator [Thermincolia bacterium]